jgi:aryl-alcohol dehydrogenase-like predicted oxidoreductase
VKLQRLEHVLLARSNDGVHILLDVRQREWRERSQQAVADRLRRIGTRCHDLTLCQRTPDHVPALGLNQMDRCVRAGQRQSRREPAAAATGDDT